MSHVDRIETGHFNYLDWLLSVAPVITQIRSDSLSCAEAVYKIFSTMDGSFLGCFRHCHPHKADVLKLITPQFAAYPIGNIALLGAFYGFYSVKNPHSFVTIRPKIEQTISRHVSSRINVSIVVELATVNY